jgi:hypothetical protein
MYHQIQFQPRSQESLIAQCRGHLNSGCILYISTGISLQAIGAGV